MQYCKILLFLALIFTTQSFASENSRNIEISIYNNDLALVKDSRNVNLTKGNNNVAFEGVATQIKPESVIIIGKDINVLEQNYDYDLITAQNIIKKSIGNTIKTVKQNPTTGENIFNTAKILSAVGTKPVLEFDYGIEPDFDGRLIFEKLPDNLHEEPTLMAKIHSLKESIQELELIYLTNGISWKTDYVARIKNNNNLDLTGWVTINNTSGIDYNNAKIGLIAGDVNQIKEKGIRSNTIMMAKAIVEDSMEIPAMGAKSEQLSSYQLYDLPNRADIKDNQTKQMSLFERFDVKYQKQGRLVSILYFSNNYKASFENKHPFVYYILNNTESGGLNLPLPTGTIRFYENDTHNNMQFIGENTINNTAKGEKIELNLGQMFNVFVNGKITNVDEISKTKTKALGNGCYNNDILKDYTAEVEFHNSGNDEVELSFIQNLGIDMKITNENIKGNAKDVNKHEWILSLPQNSNKVLEFTVRVKSKERTCD